MDITMTERAASHVKRVLAGQAQALGLRVAVKTTGCSGYAYIVEAARAIGPDDRVFESNGIKVVVSEESLKFLAGTQMDFVREGLNAGFKFNNPNVKATCGCGESFSVG
jgi:iron-sulfur cluster assembly protein